MANPTEFKKETIGKLLMKSFKDSKTKVNSDAITLTSEMLKIFVEEACQRALKQASMDCSQQVEVEHFEKILPQLLLDF